MLTHAETTAVDGTYLGNLVSIRHATLAIIRFEVIEAADAAASVSYFDSSTFSGMFPTPPMSGKVGKGIYGPKLHCN